MTDRIDVTRSRDGLSDGLSTYYRLLATTTGAISYSSGRWLFDESSAGWSVLAQSGVWQPLQCHRRRALTGAY